MKARSDSKLKTLPDDRQEQIIAWSRMPKTETCVGGLAHAREQLLADGIKVSLSTLSDFCEWWQLRHRFSLADSRAQQVVELLKEKDPSLSPDKIRALGQSLFTMEAVSAGDAETFVSLESLKLAQEVAASKGQIETEKLKLSRAKFQRDTCKLFLKWSEDERAKAILAGSGSNAEKIEALGQAMFGEDWE